MCPWANGFTSLSLISCCCSVAQLCLTLCDLVDCSTAGSSVLHCLLEFSQIHALWVGDAMQPSIHYCPLLLLSSFFPIIMVFSNESALCIRQPKCWSFSNSPSNEYSRLISFRIHWLDLLAVKGLWRVFSSTTVTKHQFFGPQSSLWSNAHTDT